MLRDNPKEIRLQDYTPPDFLIDEVELQFELGEEEALVESRLTVRRNPHVKESGSPLRLDGESLESLAVKIDGRVLERDEYRFEEGGLVVDNVPAQFVFESRVRIRPQENTALEGLYRSNGMFCTQCEAEGFRRITWFLDRPDVMARYRTTIRANREHYPVLLSNGNLVKEVSLEDDKLEATWEDPYPKPSYLFALVAGDLRCREQKFTTLSGREVALRIYVEPRDIDLCDHAMQSLRKAMAWDEQQYGREYDLDIYMIVAVSHFNMGAMENKGLNIFNAKYVLAKPTTATDQDFQNIEGVIAHEYFHNWTGNRITCRDWFQLSLKEGLTVYRDQEFSADMGSRGVKRIEDVRMLRAHQFAEDASPMAHPVRPDSYIEINNFYTTTIYEKGAEVIRMQHRLLGNEAFRKGMNLYFDRHDGQAVTTDDFVRCMADASGRDMAQFQRWYTQAGTPQLRVEGAYDAEDDCYTLTIEQHTPPTPGQPNKQALHLPFAVALLDEQGHEMPLQLENEASAFRGTRVLELRQVQETFRFVGLPTKPIPSMLRGFSAPAKLIYDYSDRDLMFLMRHDGDGFNRWDAAQSLYAHIILQRVAKSHAVPPRGFFATMEEVLTATNGDPALAAEVLTLPSESYLGDLMDVVDVDGIHLARESLRLGVATTLEEALRSVHQAENRPRDDDISPGAIASRRLRNLSLGYLMRLNDPGAISLCVEQYRRGGNMTDTINALTLIADSEATVRLELLEDFYQRWSRDPLVIDKWFMTQALSSRTDTLEQVLRLLDHPDYSITNPNRVRSLVGAFCSANPVVFHRIDGSGYRFLADQVLTLDALNPQIASRLLRTITRWRRYDPIRQALMKSELERILSTSPLSKDVFEIAAKSLE